MGSAAALKEAHGYLSLDGQAVTLKLCLTTPCTGKQGWPARPWKWACWRLAPTSPSRRGGRLLADRRATSAKVGNAHPLVLAQASVPVAAPALCPSIALPGSDQLAITATHARPARSGGSSEGPRPCGFTVPFPAQGEALGASV